MLRREREIQVLILFSYVVSDSRLPQVSKTEYSDKVLPGDTISELHLTPSAVTSRASQVNVTDSSGRVRRGLLVS